MDAAGINHSWVCKSALLSIWGLISVGIYRPPPCDFNKVTIEIHGKVSGNQFDRLGVMYLGDIEIFRTSTPEPLRRQGGIEWTYVKEMDHFNALWRKQQKLIFDLPNNLDESHDG